MLYYIIPSILALFLSIQYDFSKKGIKRTVWWVILFIYWTLLIGLRFEVGGDTYNYMITHSWQPSLKDLDFADSSYQPLFAILYSFSKTLSPDFWCFSLIHAFVVNVVIFTFFKKATRYKFLALFLLNVFCYLYFTTEIMKEVLAVLSFTLGVKYYIQKKWLYYYCSVFIASMFHLSALVLIILPFFVNLRFYSFRFIILLLALPIFLYLLNPIFDLLSVFSFLTDKMLMYKDDGFSGYLFSFLNLCKYALFPSLILYAYKRYNITCKYESLLCVLVIIGLCTIFRPVIFSRFSNYFMLILIIATTDIIGFLLSSKKKIRIQNAAIILLLGCVMYGSYYVHMKGYTRWCPYYSIFNPVSVQRYHVNLYAD